VKKKTEIQTTNLELNQSGKREYQGEGDSGTRNAPLDPSHQGSPPETRVTTACLLVSGIKTGKPPTSTSLPKKVLGGTIKGYRRRAAFICRPNGADWGGNSRLMSQWEKKGGKHGEEGEGSKVLKIYFL